MSSNVLADRDANTHLGAAKVDDLKPKNMEYHRQMLQSRMNDESATNTYVSPSDNIMSPCTAKLSAMKSKHFKKAKPQSLFAAKKAAAATVPTSAPATELGQDLPQGSVAGEEQPQPAAEEQPSMAGETVR